MPVLSTKYRVLCAKEYRHQRLILLLPHPAIPFTKLTRTEQVRQLRNSAANVLFQYGISGAKLSLLAQHRQTTFKVLAEGNRKFVLRFHSSGYRNPAAVELEMKWLWSLRDNTDVIAPVPVRTLTGEVVPTTKADNLPMDFSCSLLTWVEGKRYFRKHGPGVRVLYEVGRIMASMHNHAEHFELPLGSRCPTWNWQSLFGRTRKDVLAAEHNLLTAADRRLFERVQVRARQAMKRLGTGLHVFGLIHADLIQSNYVIHRGSVRVIDFAELGLGHFLYDIGITLYGLWGLDPHMKQRDAFLAGYRTVREISAEHERLIDVFTTARAVILARQVMTSPHPEDQAIAARYAQQVLSCIKAWNP